MENVESVRNNAIVIYRSYYEAIEKLPEADRLPVFEAIFEYALNGTEPELDGTPAAIFMLIKPTLDASRRKAANGKKGGEQNHSPPKSFNYLGLIFSPSTMKESPSSTIHTIVLPVFNSISLPSSS